MNEVQEDEYDSRRDLPEGTLLPLHTHGSPGIPNHFSHGIPSGPRYSRMDESLRDDNYSTYQILHPLACDPLPPAAHFSPYPEYILAQPSHYQQVPFSCIRSPWPSQEALRYSMSSGDFGQTVGSDGAGAYSSEDFCTYRGFRHANENQPHALLLSPHDQLRLEETRLAQTPSFAQVLQVMCEVSGGQQVMVLSPDRIPHSVITDTQIRSTEDHLIQASDVGHLGEDVSTGPPQSHRMSTDVTFSLTPYVSQLDQTQEVEHEELVETKGSESSTLEKSKRPCNCNKSQCLQLYCECFANGELCNNCNCTNCFNNTEHDSERSRAVKAYLKRNPGAFQPKIYSRKQGNVKIRHTKGCNCKRSSCLKNYCECYEAKIMCTSTCRCVGCLNYDGSPQKKSSKRDTPNPSTKCPLACITPDVVEATCDRLLTQAEVAEKEGYTAAHAERMILEEFGQCMTQIIRSMFKSSSVQFPE